MSSQTLYGLASCCSTPASYPVLWDRLNVRVTRSFRSNCIGKTAALNWPLVSPRERNNTTSAQSIKTAIGSATKRESCAAAERQRAPILLLAAEPPSAPQYSPYR